MASRPGSPKRRTGDGDGGPVVEAFRSARRSEAHPTTTSIELLPTRLAQACVSVLPVDGAGLSLHETDFRVPIGASDETATVAERLQFTQGEGPCLESASTRRSVTVDAVEMEQRWPSFADELFRRTPYRAIVSLPVAITPRMFAALDLYVVDPAAVAALGHAGVTAVIEQVADALAAAAGASAVVMVPAEDEDQVTPIWLDVEPARDRTYVWIAMGMVMSQSGLSAADAVALLRSYAYGHGVLVDDLAVELVNGTLDLGQLQP